MTKQPTVIKFTSEELDQLTTLETKYDELTIKLGQITLQRIDLDDTEKSVRDEYRNTISEENSLANLLTEKYGKGNIDIETGIFTPTE